MDSIMVSESKRNSQLFNSLKFKLKPLFIKDFQFYIPAGGVDLKVLICYFIVNIFESQFLFKTY